MKREDVSKIFDSATEEQITQILDLNSADIGKAKSKLENERDDFKSRLEDAQKRLKTFEGVDVGKLQSEIAALNADLAKKDEDYKQQIADMEFNGELDSALTASGARNAKAVKALLDIEALKASKNQSDDIKSALESVKADNDYLFTSDEPIKSPVRETHGIITGGASDALRAAMGLPAEHKSK